MAKSSVNSKNSAEAAIEHLASISSMPFFLPKKVSAPPAMEPLRPALLLDCSKTLIISAMAHSICRIVNTKVKIFHLRFPAAIFIKFKTY